MIASFVDTSAKINRLELFLYTPGESGASYPCPVVVLDLAEHTVVSTGVAAAEDVEVGLDLVHKVCTTVTTGNRDNHYLQTGKHTEGHLAASPLPDWKTNCLNSNSE